MKSGYILNHVTVETQPLTRQRNVFLPV